MITNLRDGDNFLKTLRIWTYEDIVGVFNNSKDIKDIHIIDSIGNSTNEDLLYKETGEEFDLSEAGICLLKVFEHNVPLYGKGKVFASVYLSKDENFMFLELNSSLKGEEYLRLDHIILDRRDDDKLLDIVEDNIVKFSEMVKKVERRSILTKHKILRLIKWATIREIIGETGKGKCYKI